jgi:hypothetical protein
LEIDLGFLPSGHLPNEPPSDRRERDTEMPMTRREDQVVCDIVLTDER